MKLKQLPKAIEDFREKTKKHYVGQIVTDQLIDEIINSVYVFQRKRVMKENDSKINKLRKEKWQAYRERNLVVAALSKLYPASLSLHSEEDTVWEKDWRTIVYIKIPVLKRGSMQVSWHVHDSEKSLFDHLSYGEEKWDGHTTPEKYNRLNALAGGKK